MATNTKRGNHDEALEQDSVNLHLPSVAQAARQEVRVVATKEQFSLIATTCFGSRSRMSNSLLQPNAFQVGSSKPCLQFEVAKI